MKTFSINGTTGQIVFSGASPVTIKIQSEMDKVASSVLVCRLCRECRSPGVLGGRSATGYLVHYGWVENEDGGGEGYFEIEIHFDPWTKWNFVKRALSGAFGEEVEFSD